jgi:SAM-dependent methyltransferase
LETDVHWREWGRRDPYFAVLTDPKFRKAHIDQNRAEFFRTGERRVARVLAETEERLGPISRGRALDFGSGVGRLTIPLARAFNCAIGVEISDAMIAEARKNATSRKIDNIEFVQSDATLSKVDGQFDFVTSHLVLQHIPPPRGMFVIQRLIELVKPGGVLAIDFSVKRTQSRLQRARYHLSTHIPGVRWLGGVLRGHLHREPPMLMCEYDLVAVLKLLESRKIQQTLVSTSEHGSVTVAELAARKPLSDPLNNHDT